MLDSIEFHADFYERFEQGVKIAARQKADEMAHGGAESYAEYREACGVIMGLNMSLHVLETLISKISQEEEGTD
jgi:hypothetical protein